MYAVLWIALRYDTKTTYTIIPTDIMKLLQKWEWEAHLSMFGITIEDPHVCTVLDKPKSREDWAGRQCIAIISCGLGLGSSEVLRSLRHLVQAQNHGRISHHQSLEWKRKHLTEDEKGPSLIRPTLKVFQWHRWGNFWGSSPLPHTNSPRTLDFLFF